MSKPVAHLTVALALLAAVPAIAADTRVIPVSGTVFSATEAVEVSATLVLTASILPPGPPGRQVRIATQLRNVVAVGATSHQSYTALVASNLWTLYPPTPVVPTDAVRLPPAVADFVLYPGDPILPTDSILALPVRYTVTLAATGQLLTANAAVGYPE